MLRPGTNTLALTVVKWSDATFVEDQDQWWHGGITRSVFLYATGRPYLADIAAIAGLAEDLTTGTLELLGRRRLRRDALERRLDRRGAASAAWASRSTRRRARVRPARRTPLDAGEPRADAAPGRRRRAASMPTTGPLGGARRRPGAAASTAWSTCGLTLPDVAPWSAEPPTLYPLTVTLRSPGGEVVEEPSSSGRLPARRDPRRWTCSSTASAC